MDEIIHAIVSRNVIELCYKVCINYMESKKRTINLFIEIYAKYFSHSDNYILLDCITSRIKKFDTDTYDGSRAIVELFLLLYNSHLYYFPTYEAKSTKHTLDDLAVLLMDDKNIDVCKDICASYCKNGSQDKISFNGIDDKYKNDCIWLVWFELFKMTKSLHKQSNTNELFIYVKQQFDIFTFNYNKVESKKRMNIIYNVVTKVSQHFIDRSKVVWTKQIIIKRAFLEIMFKINIIYEELGYKDCVRKKDYVHNCCMVMYPLKSNVKPKIELNYIPEDKKVKLNNQKKNCYDKVIKVNDC